MDHFSTFILAAMRQDLSQLLFAGAFVALILIAWSYTHWRGAVKVAFIAVLLEGAIRKWGLPQGQELVYFLKDVFLVGAYLKFYFAPDAELRAWRLRIPGITIFALCMFVSISALNPNIGSPILSAYGLKVYFSYVPLAFMMPYLFRTQQEMVRQLTWYALLAIPICLLGVLQWRSDKFSVINTFAAGMKETGAVGFGFGDHARITGTFSYITGHTTFVIIFFTLTLTLLSLKETKWKWLLLGINLPLLAGNALMGGARASIVSIAFVTAGFAFSAISGRIGTSKQFLAVLLAGMLAAIVGVGYMFSDAWQNWAVRYQISGDNLTSRVVEHPLDAVQAALEKGGLMGFGIGLTHPASIAVRSFLSIPEPERRVPFFDNELGQVLAELGVVGFTAWYGLRLLLLYLCWKAYRTSPPGVIRALTLAALLITGPFMLMSVVLNHTANFFIFALAGFALVPLLERTVPMGRTRQAHAARKLQAPHPHRVR